MPHFDLTLDGRRVQYDDICQRRNLVLVLVSPQELTTVRGTHHSWRLIKRGMGARCTRSRYRCPRVGSDVAAAFEQAVLATTAIVVDPSLIRLKTSADITCEAASLEDLLVEWFNAVIFEMSARRMVFGSFVVTIDGHRLTAAAHGEICVKG